MGTAVSYPARNLSDWEAEKSQAPDQLQVLGAVPPHNHT